MMKAIILAMFSVIILATGVCAQQTQAIPDLKGVWEGNGKMHFKEHGFILPDGKMTRMEVLSQEGRVIHGTLSWTHKASGKDGFSGVIDKDGVTIYLAGHDEGIRIGKLDGPDSITLYILVPGGAKPRAGFAEYTRVK